MICRALMQFRMALRSRRLSCRVDARKAMPRGLRRGALFCSDRAVKGGLCRKTEDWSLTVYHYAYFE
jgi:hypothetical protein